MEGHPARFEPSTFCICWPWFSRSQRMDNELNGFRQYLLFSKAFFRSFLHKVANHRQLTLLPLVCYSDWSLVAASSFSVINGYRAGNYLLSGRRKGNALQNYNFCCIKKVRNQSTSPAPYRGVVFRRPFSKLEIGSDPRRVHLKISVHVVIVRTGIALCSGTCDKISLAHVMPRGTTGPIAPAGHTAPYSCQSRQQIQGLNLTNRFCKLLGRFMP